jgi:hypothetical protein
MAVAIAPSESAEKNSAAGAVSRESSSGGDQLDDLLRPVEQALTAQRDGAGRAHREQRDRRRGRERRASVEREIRPDRGPVVASRREEHVVDQANPRGPRRRPLEDVASRRAGRGHGPQARRARSPEMREGDRCQARAGSQGRQDARAQRFVAARGEVTAGDEVLEGAERGDAAPGGTWRTTAAPASRPPRRAGMVRPRSPAAASASRFSRGRAVALRGARRADVPGEGAGFGDRGDRQAWAVEDSRPCSGGSRSSPAAPDPGRAALGRSLSPCGQGPVGCGSIGVQRACGRPRDQPGRLERPQRLARFGHVGTAPPLTGNAATSPNSLS